MHKAVHFHKSEASRIKPGSKVRGGFVWLDYLNPSIGELRNISRDYNIHISGLEDALDSHERARIHSHDNYHLIIYKVPTSYGNVLRTSSVGIFWSGNTVITIHKKEIKGLSKALENNSSNLENPIMFIRFILETLTDAYFETLEEVGNYLEKVEEKAISSMETHIGDIFKIKKTFIYFQKALLANREVLMSIKEGRIFVLSKKESLAFGDIYNDNLQLIDLTSIYSDVLSSIMETDIYSTSNAMGEVVKKLTVVASFALVPTLIASIYGMNFRTSASVWNMPELNWIYGYPFSLGLMLASVTLMYFYFRGKKWI